MASVGAVRLRSALADLALVVAIGLCLVAASIFGFQALHGVLRPMFGPTGASALLGGMMLIVALALALYLSVRRNRQVRAIPLVAPVEGPSAPPNTPPDLVTSAAFLAGFLLARRLF
jgi:hypothetical protein